MKQGAFLFAIVSNTVCGTAYAQSANDPMETLRTCSAMERPSRLECLDELSRTVAPQNRRPSDESWVVSETTSPVDYSPIVTATRSSPSGPDGAAMQLSIRCRKGRTELVVAGPALSRKADKYVISYRIDANPPVQLTAASPSFGAGVAFRGDVVPLLQSLPEEGDLIVRLSGPTSAVQEGHFLLRGLKNVREKLAPACKWPHAVARPEN
jgi:hypothetical protein